MGGGGGGGGEEDMIGPYVSFTIQNLSQAVTEAR